MRLYDFLGPALQSGGSCNGVHGSESWTTLQCMPMHLSCLALPLFGINSLFRLNTANISYLYQLVYFSLYNTPVLHLGLNSLPSSVSLPSHLSS